MKKAIILAAALFFAATAFGQEKTGVSIALGPSMDIYHYNSENWQPKMLSGFFVRAEYEYHLTKMSGVSAGLRFDYIGLGDFSKNQDETTTWKKAYLDIPIRYNLHIGGFYLTAGPVVKFVVGYKHTVTNDRTGSSITTNDLTEAPELFNKVHFALGGGLGYEFNSGIRIFIDYDYDFTNFVKVQSPILPTKSKSSGVSIGIGYRF